MTKTYSGNPYTHAETSRECITNTDHTLECYWCGNRPNRLYNYNDRIGYFCNKQCFHDYYD